MDITYHWFAPGIDMNRCRRLEEHEGPTIYEYACGQLGSPFHGPHQMHHLNPREHLWDTAEQRMRARSGVLFETNCATCKKVWDAVDARRGDDISFDLRLKLYREVIERKTFISFHSAERLEDSSYLSQSGEAWTY